jgi:hypothetical protein
MTHRAVVGLPIFTSDGKEVGKVLATGTDGQGQTLLVAAIARPLGVGSVAVGIPTDMFVLMSDHIVLAITEAEVGERLTGANPGRRHDRSVPRLHDHAGGGGLLQD